MKKYQIIGGDKNTEENELLVQFDSTQDKVTIVSRKGEIIEITMPSSSYEFEINKRSNSIEKPEKIYPLAKK